MAPGPDDAAGAALLSFASSVQRLYPEGLGSFRNCIYFILVGI